ncbi:hypothetical protein EW145_g5068 [Phellinidium pouzarii]|uniref:Methyltransferase domain-containing protein n=1 Tax=Phellinidium pouzarii TaxID=167371 RepID=A0A4S4L366_9AGAM|nr:hypothetical protein EW145_g5068 [Phellinidium pouzarii]
MSSTLDNEPTVSSAVAIPHVSQRSFHNYPGAAYVLPADEQEIERLRQQHNIWKTAFNGKILLPPFKPQSSYFVLDSGSGPAAFLLDLCSQLAQTSVLHGIDIEKRLFPLSHPSNVSFSIASVTSLPDEWTSKFDFVHQRLLFFALKRTEWTLAMDQIHRVLSPGGWVQFGEYGYWHSGPINEKYRQMQNALAESRGFDAKICADLPRLLQKAGFINVTVEKRTVPLGAWAGQVGVDSRNNFISVFAGLKMAVLKAGGLGFVETEEDFDGFTVALQKEWDETEGSEIEFHIVYAQRPN